MNFPYKKSFCGILYIICYFTSILSVEAQIVYEFNSQSDLNLFSQDLSTINGDLIINGDDIDNLFPLSLIQHITGHLIIGDTLAVQGANDILTSLEGLNKLKTIGKDLRIIGNPVLNSLHGLHNLETIGEDIIWKNLPVLNSVESLELTTNNLNGDLLIDNTGLNSLVGLHNLQSITGTFTLFNNQNLTQIDLANLSHIYGGLHAVNNTLIANFVGLENFEFLGADLVLIVNNGLANLDGLEALSIIDGDLAITANGALNNLDALSNVEVVTDSLIVNYNSNLTSCCGIFPALNHEDTGLIIIEANSINCSSETEIIEYCSTVDTDEDGIADIDDNCPAISNSEQIDEDSDGFGQTCDCNDNLATVNADAVEIFNNEIDDDCDGEIDEGSPIIPDCSTFSATIFSQTDVSCAGGNDGTIILSYEDATMPLICEWSHNSENLQNIDNLAAGNYEVTLTDANGCSSSLSTVISEPEQLTTELMITPANCEEIDGQIDLTVSGGTAPYHYNWGQGMGNSEDLQDLAPNNYNLTITDANGCQNTILATVTELGCPDFIYFQFTAFKAKLLPSKEVKIEFSTIGELDQGTYFLEHSMDGIEFKTVENQIVGIGFNENENDYSSSHFTPEMGKNYYRIMYLNFDNAIYKSEVQEVIITKITKDIIFPNPCVNLINIQLNDETEESIELKIYSEAGIELMYKKFETGTDLLTLDISKIPPAVYFMRVNSGHSLLMTEKIVKLD